MLSTLWASRKFRIMCFDFVISAIAYFGGKYLAPSAFADIQWFLLGAQPILISLVLGIAIEDNGTNANPALVAPVEPVSNPPASMVQPASTATVTPPQ